MLDEYFRAETAALEQRCLAGVSSLQDWTSRRDEYRRELREMLGLDPLPDRTPLRAEVRGSAERGGVVAERILFQSSPGLYGTGALFRPTELKGRAPGILYLCGHANIKDGGVSYGAKAHYQYYGAWLARHGYVCLTLDSLENGEIPGDHHGTHSGKMWWWNARGYTPAGVETWNAIRALDYLQSRPEVDPERLGVTGRSGGGAYTWYVAALDERVKVAIPTAGITDLRNHVVDGVIAGHCDCMYVVNTYRWDYPLVAALVAPRPLLVANTDKDGIFPLDGVVRVYEHLRRLYRLYGAEKQLGLTITEGPHQDTQELQLPELRWFNRFLRGENPLIEDAPVSLFRPEELRVLPAIPADQLNTAIHESFVPAALAPPVPASRQEWETRRTALLSSLRAQCFAGWPGDEEPLDAKEVFNAQRNGMRLAAYDFVSQAHVPLRLFLAQRAGPAKPELVVLNVLDAQGWAEWLASARPEFETELRQALGPDEDLPPADAQGAHETEEMFRRFPWAMAYVAPRGIGPTAWSGDERRQVQIRRRFMLLGQTLDGMRVWDVRRACRALESLPEMQGVPVWLQGERTMSGIALYAALFQPEVARVDLWQLPRSHREGPDFLNVLKILDVPATVALAAEHTRVRIYEPEPGGWEYPQAVAKALGWDEKKIKIRQAPSTRVSG